MITSIFSSKKISWFLIFLIGTFLTIIPVTNSYAQSGCCSHHKGVKVGSCDSATDHKICNDGSVSDTCKCDGTTSKSINHTTSQTTSQSTNTNKSSTTHKEKSWTDKVTEAVGTLTGTTTTTQDTKATSKTKDSKSKESKTKDKAKDSNGKTTTLGGVMESIVGCCSGHGGVGKCNKKTGYLTCKDKTQSATCTCEKTKKK